MTNGYEAVIGLEVHVELKTDTKMFCSCPTTFGSEPNTQICPVCMGHPGALPVVNRHAVELAICAGHATNCKINQNSSFDRKNYFYPDLPKGYQITQFFHPICRDGYLIIDASGTEKKIGITRIHMEEDAGKLFHRDAGTLIDCNRCGVPLIEIVTEPDMRSASEATAFLQALRSNLIFAGVSDCKMNEGSLRVDVNISAHRPGDPFGTRCEIKNINSFKFIEKAIDFEFRRQCEILSFGGTIEQETRRFDEYSRQTFPMRKKEEPSDYRYIIEYDLPPLSLSLDGIESITRSVPQMPRERAKSYFEMYGIPLSDGATLTLEPEMAKYFEEGAAQCRYPKIFANFLIVELSPLGEAEEIEKRIPPHRLCAVAELFGDKIINSAVAKKLIKELWNNDFDPISAVKECGLEQIRDDATLSKLAISAIDACPKALEDFKKGKASAAKSIIGKAMSLCSGRADPELLQNAIIEALKNK